MNDRSNGQTTVCFIITIAEGCLPTSTHQMLYFQYFGKVFFLILRGGGGERKHCPTEYKPFPKQALVFTCLQNKSFENTVGKGEIARNEQFLLFPQCFLLRFGELSAISLNLKLLSAKSFGMEESIICRSGKV